MTILGFVSIASILGIVSIVTILGIVSIVTVLGIVSIVTHNCDNSNNSIGVRIDQPRLRPKADH